MKISIFALIIFLGTGLCIAQEPKSIEEIEEAYRRNVDAFQCFECEFTWQSGQVDQGTWRDGPFQTGIFSPKRGYWVKDGCYMKYELLHDLEKERSLRDEPMTASHEKHLQFMDLRQLHCCDRFLTVSGSSFGHVYYYRSVHGSSGELTPFNPDILGGTPLRTDPSVIREEMSDHLTLTPADDARPVSGELLKMMRVTETSTGKQMILGLDTSRKYLPTYVAYVEGGLTRFEAWILKTRESADGHYFPMHWRILEHSSITSVSSNGVKTERTWTQNESPQIKELKVTRLEFDPKIQKSDLSVTPEAGIKLTIVGDSGLYDVKTAGLPIGIDEIEHYEEILRQKRMSDLWATNKVDFFRHLPGYLWSSTQMRVSLTIIGGVFATIILFWLLRRLSSRPQDQVT